MKETMIANRSLLFAAALTAVLGMTLPVSAGVLFSDNFTGNAISPDWVTGASGGGSAGTIVQTGGQLVTTVTTASGNHRAVAATVDQTSFNFFNQPMDVTVNIASWGTPTLPTGATKPSSSNYFVLIGGRADNSISGMYLGEKTRGVGVMIFQNSNGSGTLWLEKRTGPSTQSTTTDFTPNLTLSTGTTSLKFTMHMDANYITVALLNGATFSDNATSFTRAHNMSPSDFAGGYRLILGARNNTAVGASGESFANYDAVSVTTPVPEPASLALLMSGGLLIVSRRRQSHRKN